MRYPSWVNTPYRPGRKVAAKSLVPPSQGRPLKASSTCLAALVLVLVLGLSVKATLQSPASIFQTLALVGLVAAILFTVSLIPTDFE